MRSWITVGMLLAAWFGGTAASGQEALPTPRVVVPAAPPPVVVVPLPPGVSFKRTSAYDVWQYQGVTQNGRFRPLVIYGPEGAYYLYDGRPYPWAGNRPTIIRAEGSR